MLQVFQVALHYWLKVGIDYYCRGAFVFAEFGEDLVRNRERDLQGLQGVCDSELVLRIREGEEQRDGNRFGICGCDFLGEIF